MEGESAFWDSKVAHYLFFRGFDQTVALLKKHDLNHQVSYIEDSRQVFYSKSTQIRTSTIELFVSSLLILCSSVLLFAAMHALYFEQYRHEIFVKRISGLNFFAIHKNYLGLQFGVILWGFLISLLWLRNLLAPVLVLVGASAILVVMLKRRSRREQSFRVSVLKGGVV